MRINLRSSLAALAVVAFSGTAFANEVVYAPSDYIQSEITFVDDQMSFQAEPVGSSVEYIASDAEPSYEQTEIAYVEGDSMPAESDELIYIDQDQPLELDGAAMVEGVMYDTIYTTEDGTVIQGPAMTTTTY